MRKKLFYMLLCIGILTLPTFAIAGPIYIAGGLSSISLDVHKHDNCRADGPEVVFGWQALKNVALEIHYMEGNDGEEDNIPFELSAWSGFAKINLFASCEPSDKEKAQLYALLGWTQLETKFLDGIPDSLVENEALNRTEKISSFSYGAGFQVPIKERGNIRVEFKHLIEDGFWDASSITALLGIKF